VCQNTKNIDLLIERECSSSHTLTSSNDVRIMWALADGLSGRKGLGGGSWVVEMITSHDH